MTIEELEKLFDKYKDTEIIGWKNVYPQRSLRPDIHAFLLLQDLVPGTHQIVVGAEHDKIYLDVELGELIKVITEEQVCELCRCGIFVEDDHSLLCMFV